MDMQKLVDTLNEAGKRTRSDYHVTLGQAIDVLSRQPGDKPVKFDWNDAGPADAHSYRGYYSDLALESVESTSVGELRKDLEDVLGETLEGYKGGDFYMGNDTPLWAANYGCCGRAVVDIIVRDDGTVMFVTKNVDL